MKNKTSLRDKSDSAFVFSKMHGAGNDFIISFAASSFFRREDFIKKICTRKEGAGADGVIFIDQSISKGDNLFLIEFRNSDGSYAEMCGNGLRCAALFVKNHLTDNNSISFETASGKLDTKIISDNIVEISIPVVEQFSKIRIEDIDIYKGSTGVPHAVVFSEKNLEDDISRKAKFIRFHNYFSPEGTNVDFAEIPKNFYDPIKIRTYERGVEAETSACGTGAAAVAISAFKFRNFPKNIKIQTKLNYILKIYISCHINEDMNFVKLSGPAEEIFQSAKIYPDNT